MAAPATPPGRPSRLRLGQGHLRRALRSAAGRRGVGARCSARRALPRGARHHRPRRGDRAAAGAARGAARLGACPQGDGAGPAPAWPRCRGRARCCASHRNLFGPSQAFLSMSAHRGSKPLTHDQQTTEGISPCSLKTNPAHRHRRRGHGARRRCLRHRRRSRQHQLRHRDNGHLHLRDISATGPRQRWGSNARSGPAAGGSIGKVSSVSTSGFKLSTSTGEKVTVKETSSTKYEKGTKSAIAERRHERRDRPRAGNHRQHDDHRHAGHRGTDKQRVKDLLGSGSLQAGAPSTSKQNGQIPASYKQGPARSSAEPRRIRPRKPHWRPTLAASSTVL